MSSWIERVIESLGRGAGKFERAKMSILSNGRATQYREPEFLRQAISDQRWSGGDYWGDEISAQRRALTNSWVFSAIMEISGEVTAAGKKVVRQTGGDEQPQEIQNHPFEELMSQPNPVMGQAFLWMYTSIWLKLDGNAYWYLSSDRSGLNAIWPLPSDSVSPVPSDKSSGPLVDAYTYTVNGIQYRIPAFVNGKPAVCHFQNIPNPWNLLDGFTELVAGMLPLDSDLAMARWNGKFFGKQNTMPSAVINLKSGDPGYPIEEADRKSLEDDLRSDYVAAERRTLVTTAPGGIDVSLLGWSPRDTDFLEGRKFTRREIYEIYGIPEGRTAMNATEANAIVAERIFKTSVYNRSLVPLAQQATSQIIIPYYGHGYELQAEDIRPANRQLELQEVEKAKGALTINEVRRNYYKLPVLEDWRGDALYTGSDPTPPAIELGTEAQTPKPEPKPEPEPDPDEKPEETSQEEEEPEHPDEPEKDQAQKAQRWLDASDLEIAMIQWAHVEEDLRNWRAKAVKHFKAGKPMPVQFTSDVIPNSWRLQIIAGLQEAKSRDDIRSVFAEFLGKGQGEEKALGEPFIPLGSEEPLPPLPGDDELASEADFEEALALWDATMHALDMGMYAGLLNAPVVNEGEAEKKAATDTPSLWFWNDRVKRYQGAAGSPYAGQFISAEKMTLLRDRFIEAQYARMDQLSQRMLTREISVQEWTLEFRKLLKNTYTDMYFAARGGRHVATPADWGRLGAMIKGQYGYLQNFAEEVRSGKLSAEQIQWRARMYIDSSVSAFEHGYAAAFGVTLPAYPGDGKTSCIVNCRCHWEIIETDYGYECYWRLDLDPDVEHCQDCLDNSSRWNPLVLE